jgi:hypothetical protein
MSEERNRPHLQESFKGVGALRPATGNEGKSLAGLFRNQAVVRAERLVGGKEGRATGRGG